MDACSYTLKEAKPYSSVCITAPQTFLITVRKQAKIKELHEFYNESYLAEIYAFTYRYYYFQKNVSYIAS